jgi:hypothetical protein
MKIIIKPPLASLLFIFGMTGKMIKIHFQSIIFCILKNNVPLMPLRFNLIKLSLEKIYYWRTTTLFYYYYYYYYYYIAN